MTIDLDKELHWKYIHGTQTNATLTMHNKLSKRTKTRTGTGTGTRTRERERAKIWVNIAFLVFCDPCWSNARYSKTCLLVSFFSSIYLLFVYYMGWFYSWPSRWHTLICVFVVWCAECAHDCHATSLNTSYIQITTITSKPVSQLHFK